MASNVSEIRTPRALALAQLKASGLDEVDMKRLKMRTLTAAETVKESSNSLSVATLAIPYFEADGRSAKFTRYRLLEEPQGFSKGRAGKQIKYWQPKDSPVRAYLPPLVEWLKIITNHEVPVWFTEGEKKAACACKHGVACIGLGGVWSWKSAKARNPLIPDLAQFNWEGRRVILCFDTDPHVKPEVEGALSALASMLSLKGADVERLQLPLLAPGSKTGLDDFIVAKGIDALAKLEVEPTNASDELFKLNQELAIINEPPSILVVKTRRLAGTQTALRDIIYASRRVSIVDAAGRLVDAPAVGQWLKWPHAKRYNGIAYEPGEPEVLGDGNYNLWSGWAAKPKRGDVSLFRKYMDYIFENSKSEARTWFERWLAYPLQHPGAKLYTAVVFWSREQRTGKTLMGKTMKHIYGKNYALVTEKQLHGDFNQWQLNKQFILGDEVTGSDRRGEMDKLKGLITSETIEVNLKHQPQYDIRNCANYLFTSNHPDAFLLEECDQRFMVHELVAEKLCLDFFDEYVNWIESAAGAGALFYHLLNLDLGDFRWNAPAPFTEAKKAMIALSGSEVDLVARNIRDAPDATLRIAGEPLSRDLHTLQDIYAACGNERIGPQALGRALSRVGMRALEQTRTSRGVLRLWPIRNREHWYNATHAQRIAGYEGDAVKPGKKPSF